MNTFKDDCKYCGKILFSDWKYCANCGGILDNVIKEKFNIMMNNFRLGFVAFKEGQELVSKERLNTFDFFDGLVELEEMIDTIRNSGWDSSSSC